jgi:UDP-N-acetylmuramyl pentapeptide synthase
MRAAIKSFSELKAGKKVLILGDMLELGERSEEEHRKLLDDIRKVKYERCSSLVLNSEKSQMILNLRYSRMLFISGSI